MAQSRFLFSQKSTVLDVRQSSEYAPATCHMFRVENNSLLFHAEIIKGTAKFQEVF